MCKNCKYWESNGKLGICKVYKMNPKTLFYVTTKGELITSEKFKCKEFENE